MVTTPLFWSDLGTINTVDNVSGNNQQNQVKVIQLSNGNLLYTWTSDANPIGFPGNTAGNDIIGQIYDPLGNPVGGEFEVGTLRTQQDRVSVDITPLEGGGFMAVYEDVGSGDKDVLATVFDDNGNFLRSFEVEDDPASNTNSEVASVSATSAMVAYTGVSGNLFFDIWNPSNGTQTVNLETVSSSATSDVTSHDIASLSNDSYAIVYSTNQTSGNDRLNLELYDAAGTYIPFGGFPVGTALTISSTFAQVYDPSVTSLTNDRFVVSYTVDGSGGSNTGLRFRIFDNDGTAIGGEINPLTTTAGNQTLSEVVALDNGEFMIAWYDEGTHDIHAQRFSSTGSTIGVEFHIQDYAIGSSTVEDISMTRMADGRVTIAWTQNVEGTTGGNREIISEIWDSRDTINADHVSGYQIGTTLNDDFLIDDGAQFVHSYDGNDSIHLEYGEVAGLIDLDGGDGFDALHLDGDGLGGNPDLFDLRGIDIKGIEQIILNSDVEQTLQLFGQQLLDLSNLVFDADDFGEIVEVHLGSLTTLNLSGFTLIDAGVEDSFTIIGDGAAETITGTALNDTIIGGGGADILNGFDGDDEFFGGGGDDSFDGGNGIDTLNYAETGGGATFDMNAGTGLFSGGLVESYVNIENIIGTSGDDVFYEETGVGNFLTGGLGSDTYHIASNIGEDSVQGDGDDTINFSGNSQDGILFTYSNNLGGSFLFGRAELGGQITSFGFIFNVVGTNQNDHFEGSDQGDVFFGLDGTDVMLGSLGNDELYGGQGYDNLNGGAGDDILDGGAGGNVVSYLGALGGVTVNLNIVGFQQDTVNAGMDSLTNFSDLSGSDFDDTLTGDANANIIYGDEGSDIINGGDGNDTLYGGDGFGNLNGDGNDTINGGAGNDTIEGNQGNDIIDGGSGIDIIDAGSGDDTIIVDLGYYSGVGEFYNGGGGSDTIDISIFAFDGTFNLSAGTFDAGLGGSGDFTFLNIENILAGSGDDILIGQTGSFDVDNFFHGGDGDDVLIGGSGDDSLDGGTGVDLLDYSQETGTLGIVIDLEAGTATDTYGDTDAIANIENVIGTLSNDIIIGDEFNNTLRGLGGDDTLEGGIGASTLIGGAGADTLIGGGGSATATYVESAAGVTIDLLAGTGLGGDAEGDTFTDIATIIGSAFNDVLTGDAENNNFFGGDGNDRFDGGAGNDFMDGQDGADTFIGGAGNDTYFGGDGFDTLDYRGAASRVVFDLTTGGTLGDAAGDNYFSIERAYGSDFNDTINGTAANEFFFGEGGNDTINAGDGIDRVYGGDGNDIQRGQEGNDVLYGSAGSDQLNGGADFDIARYDNGSSAVIVNLATGGTGGDAVGDTYFGIEAVYGSDFNDTLTGNNSVNELRGGDGDDILNGAGGNDRLFGGLGADVLDGGTGTDIANYTVAQAAVTVDLIAGGTGGEAAGDSYVSIEWVFGSEFNDTITGDAGNNRLEGRNGDDILNGGDGNDRILGGKDNDTINGGDGVDTIFGQSGDDTMSGGGGNDFFFGDEGTDSHDGGTGIDTVSYLASTSGVTLNMDTGGTDGDAAGDSYASIERIFGSGFDDSITGDETANTLLGNGGADYLAGAGGNDSLNGGAGIDSFGYDTTSDDADAVQGFTLNETIYILGGDPAFDTWAEVMAVGTDVGANVIFDFGSGNTLTIVGHSLADLSASNFDFGGTPPAAEPLDNIGSYEAEYVANYESFAMFDMDGDMLI